MMYDADTNTWVVYTGAPIPKRYPVEKAHKVLELLIEEFPMNKGTVENNYNYESLFRPLFDVSWSSRQMFPSDNKLKSKGTSASACSDADKVSPTVTPEEWRPLKLDDRHLFVCEECNGCFQSEDDDIHKGCELCPDANRGKGRIRSVTTDANMWDPPKTDPLPIFDDFRTLFATIQGLRDHSRGSSLEGSMYPTSKSEFDTIVIALQRMDKAEIEKNRHEFQEALYEFEYIGFPAIMNVLYYTLSNLHSTFHRTLCKGQEYNLLERAYEHMMTVLTGAHELHKEKIQKLTEFILWRTINLFQASFFGDQQSQDGFENARGKIAFEAKAYADYYVQRQLFQALFQNSQSEDDSDPFNSDVRRIKALIQARARPEIVASLNLLASDTNRFSNKFETHDHSHVLYGRQSHLDTLDKPYLFIRTGKKKCLYCNDECNHTVLGSETEKVGNRTRVIRAVEFCDKQRTETGDIETKCIICKTNTGSIMDPGKLFHWAGDCKRLKKIFPKTQVLMDDNHLQLYKARVEDAFKLQCNVK